MIIRADETAKDSDLAVNSNNLNFPASNVLDSRLAKLYRTVSGITTAEITFDAGSIINVTSVVIGRHNISSSASAIKLQGNSVNMWGSPAFEEDLTWDSGFIYADFVQQSFRYWRIQIIDATNSDTYIQMGRVWIGDNFITPGISFLIPHDRKSASKKNITPSGNSYQDTRYRFSLVAGRWPKVTESENNIILDLLDTVDIGIPHFVTFDKAGSILETLYVTMNQDGYKSTPLGARNLYTISFKYREEV